MGNGTVYPSISHSKDKQSGERTISKTNTAGHEPMSTSFGHGRDTTDEKKGHSFRANDRDEAIMVQEGSKHWPAPKENTKEEDRSKQATQSFRGTNGQRKTTGTEENLFQYSATNDRLQDREGVNSYEDYESHRYGDYGRHEEVDIHEYMGSMQDRGNRFEEAEVYNKIRSDILYSKDRGEVSDTRASAFETANRLLNSKIIGHLTHHQTKVEQMVDVSQRVPASRAVPSKHSEHLPQKAVPSREKPASYSLHQDYKNVRNKDYAGQTRAGVGLQK